jgi:hypothetical protein
LEDGSEILNRIENNVFAFAKSGFTNKTLEDGSFSNYAFNKREVSGIFCHPGPDVFPYPECGYSTNNTYAQCAPLSRQWNSDCVTPTLFWIRNPYNYINYNYAVGTEWSGAAYWFVSNPMNGASEVCFFGLIIAC